jgi:hypothetical protein
VYTRRFCESETPIFHCAGGEETETNGGLLIDWTLDQMRSRHDQTRPVSGSCCAWRGALGFATGAYGPSRDRRVRSSPRETAKSARSIGRCGASGHDRPDASGRERELTGRPDAGTVASGSSCSASGHWLTGAGAVRSARPVVAWRASGHTLPKSVTFRDYWKSNERNSKRDTWRASHEVALVRPDAGRVRSTRAERHLESNGSILWGCL